MAYNYTDNEIEETLQEMGIELPNRSYFNNLRQDLNNRDNRERQFEVTNDNLAEFMQNIDNQAGPVRYMHYEWGRTTIDHVGETIKRANDMMLLSVDHMTDLEKMVENFFYNDYENYAEDEVVLEPEIPISPTPYRGRDSSQDNKENVRIEQPKPFVPKPRPMSKRNEPPNPTEERRKIGEFLKKNCLMRASPRPGRPPFKTDRLKLLAKYREEWTKNPGPGEAKRLSLRWKIRQWMMRQDIPFIRLQKPASLQVTRPEWVD